LALFGSRRSGSGSREANRIYLETGEQAPQNPLMEHERLGVRDLDKGFEVEARDESRKYSPPTVVRTPHATTR
jgi:hypothetical protein